MHAHGHIIAMGGGGFSEEPDNPLLDTYILKQARSSNPTVCFLPTASGDSEGYIARFYSAFSVLNCRPRHLPLSRLLPEHTDLIEGSDVIYVGGGHTIRMLAIWRELGVDQRLERAWKNGAVLCGLSAGAICWFESGHTDSTGELAAMRCLGFLSGSCSPHYDSEAQRRPSYRALIQDEAMPSGYALDDGAAVHFRGSEFVGIVTSRPKAGACYVSRSNEGAVEAALETHYLGNTG